MLLQHGKKLNACVGSCAELGSLFGSAGLVGCGITIIWCTNWARGMRNGGFQNEGDAQHRRPLICVGSMKSFLENT